MVARSLVADFRNAGSPRNGAVQHVQRTLDFDACALTFLHSRMRELIRDGGAGPTTGKHDRRCTRGGWRKASSRPLGYHEWWLSPGLSRRGLRLRRLAREALAVCPPRAFLEGFPQVSHVTRADIRTRMIHETCAKCISPKLLYFNTLVFFVNLIGDFGEPRGAAWV